MGTLINATATADGGTRYVYANDLSTNLASRPALVVLTTDPTGRVVHARRDVARRTFTDERKRDEADDVERGDRVRIRGTVKGHGNYRGQDQTVLTRAKVDTVE